MRFLAGFVLFAVIGMVSVAFSCLWNHPSHDVTTSSSRSASPEHVSPKLNGGSTPQRSIPDSPARLLPIASGRAETVTVIVLDDETSRPIAGAEVVWTLFLKGTLLVTKTDSAGVSKVRLQSGRLDFGDFGAVVHANGYEKGATGFFDEQRTLTVCMKTVSRPVLIEVR